MSTLSEAVGKISDVIKEVEDMGFDVSLIGNIDCHIDGKAPIHGACLITHKQARIKNNIIANFVEENNLNITLE